MTLQSERSNGPTPLTGTIVPSDAGQSSWSERIILIWLLGMLVLLPVDLITLPLNMALVDCWTLMGLPILWFLFIRGRYVISLPYTVALWIILIASLASTFAAPAPRNSLIVMLKEMYIYIWFVTLVAVLSRLNARDLRRVLVVWIGMVFVHGLVIVGQFLSPSFWRLTTSLAGSLKNFEMYRPSGLFVNANLAAFFQLLGFVPLVLVSPSKKTGIILGVLLLPTMLLTGSMGATLALVVGLTVAFIAISLTGHLALMIKMFAQLAVIMLVLGGLLTFIASHNARYQEHFQRILVGRSEKSSSGRFDLWGRGLDAYLDNDVFLWGVGPENFREVDEKMTDNQLHNDFLAFSVERGLLGTLGLGLFAITAVGRAAYMVLISHRYPDRASLVVVVFLAAMIAAMIESLTHQIFHFHVLWLVLALQEAMLYRMTASKPSNPLRLSGSRMLREDRYYLAN